MTTRQMLPPTFDFGEYRVPALRLPSDLAELSRVADAADVLALADAMARATNAALPVTVVARRKSA